jgi:type I restriction enzyme S subunit
MPEARTHLEANATGSSHSMRNISQETLKATPIPVPPIDTQKRIGERLNNAQEAIDQLRLAIKASLQDIEQLPARLLAEAFGEG